MKQLKSIPTTQFFIQGLVQGVGFRPFIFRLATSLQLRGIVYNQNNGVVVQLQGEQAQIQQFNLLLKSELPEAACINTIKTSIIESEAYPDFTITPSQKIDRQVTGISPDIAVCKDCLNDLQNQTNRINYPFINCTNCGPRFSIIEDLPYDRPQTSMQEFEMCMQCREEYINIFDRRFHAQPIACNNCGPKYELIQADQKQSSYKEILPIISNLIDQGDILIIKSLGGYNICCDAFNEKAVLKIRNIKQRDGKPFAIMFRSLSSAKKHLLFSAEEEKALTSWQRPIILSTTKTRFSKDIADKVNTIGAFLPYLPIHYQLFEMVKTDALVMTSGNISNCPIIIDNENAINVFANKKIPVLIHNRDIVNRVDDSVAQFIGGKIRVIRRSRGYVPTSHAINYPTEGIFAAGAELANTFAVGKGNDAILSQHIGDLKNFETLEFYEQSFKRFKKLFDFSPTHAVCDMHPEYLSGKFAQKLGLPITKVQHHHAHIATTMAEYSLDEPVIGIAFDGTGYGTDGKTWGSEFFIADLEKFERIYHFEYIPIPGGDKVAEEPWRSAVAYLYNSFNKVIPENLAFLNNISCVKIKLLATALKKGLNTPESCSAGRLFDAVSAIINLCTVASYHAEAPISLEHYNNNSSKESYSISLASSISWKTAIKEIIFDLNNNIPGETVSSKFHNTIVKIIYEGILEIQRQSGINKVVLSGGCFQNKFISENLLDLLHKSGIKVFLSARFPCNDGGVSLGQMAIAAKSIALCV